MNGGTKQILFTVFGKKRTLEFKMAKLRKVEIEEEDFFYSLSFDIYDFIGDGVWWLQVYDSDKQMIYDKPFAASTHVLSDESVNEGVSEALALMRPI